MWYYAKDGQQNGPISREEMAGLVQQQQIPSNALVWREGMTQWAPADQVPEFAAMAPAGMMAQPMPGLAYAQPPQTNSMAMTSMILGICSVVVAGIFTAIPAIICGHIARRQIRKAAGSQTGDGMAVAGLIIGYLISILTVVLVVGIVVFIIFFVASVAPSSPAAPFTPTPPPAPIGPSIL